MPSDEKQAENAVQMRGVSYRWNRTSDFVLTVDDFAVVRGRRLLLLGPSGSGKSTLLSLMTGVIAPQSGTVSVLGTRLETMSGPGRDRFRAEHFGIVFQMFNLLPYGSAIDNVVLPLSFAPNRRRHAVEAGGEQAEARRLLLALGVAGPLHRQPAAHLSVGQQQRVAVARALIGSPEILVADEPTSALDEDRRDDFLNLLFDQVEEAKATLVMVSHDRRLASRFTSVADLRDIVSGASGVAA